MNESIYLFENDNNLLFFKYNNNHPQCIDMNPFTLGKFKLFY